MRPLRFPVKRHSYLPFRFLLQKLIGAQFPRGGCGKSRMRRDGPTHRKRADFHDISFSVGYMNGDLHIASSFPPGGAIRGFECFLRFANMIEPTSNVICDSQSHSLQLQSISPTCYLPRGRCFAIPSKVASERCNTSAKSHPDLRAAYIRIATSWGG